MTSYPPEGLPNDPGGDRPWERGVWDRGLQPERTKLSWQRTALSCTACSLVIARLVGQTHAITGIVVAIVAVACGVMIGLSARRRIRRSVRAVHSQGRLPDAKTYLVMSGLIVVAGFGACYLAFTPSL